MATEDDWVERVRRASEVSLRRRVERAGARRAAAERRRRGVALRTAWRQARRDARAADDGRPPPDALPRAR